MRTSPARRRRPPRRPPRVAPPSPQLGLDVAAGAQDGVAHQHGRAGGRRLLVVGHDGRVAHDHRDRVDRHAQLLGGDLGKDRPRALADVRRARVDDDAAVGQQADDRVRQAGRRARLDARARCRAPDRRASACPSRSARPPVARSAPIAVGRRVERDERVAALGQVAQAELDRVDARARRAASVMFDSTAQLICGLPKPRKAVEGTVCDSTLRAMIRAAGQLYGPLPM